MKPTRQSHLAAAVSCCVLGLAMAPGCAVDSPESEPEARSVAENDGQENTGEAESAVTDCSKTECGNCVKHARCLKTSLPYGLDTCAGKKAIINTQTPAVGSVAVMNVGAWCHVGYVSKITGSGASADIWLDEANYTAGACTTTRHGTAAALKILGYFK